ncbi:MAG TPA: glycosyltransferase family 1 protein [Terracidiphilus sp.]|jgi:glycosyltransferase involved in cell wall biosynthesis|nr:glycosyltransferase family 1 protein [Terracidiphilus sp.]
MTARRLKIGLELHFLDGRVQGLRTHCVEVFSRVVRSTPEIDFYCMMAKPELLEKEGFTSPNVIPVPIRHSGRLQRYAFSIPSLVRKHKLDLLHCQFSAPPIVSCKTAITIHDILAETHPEYFGRMYRILARMTQTIAVRHAIQIYTVSEYSRRKIARVYDIPENRITVLLNAVDEARFVPRADGHRNEIENRGLVPGGYVLTVGRLEPRKNHKRLFEAYARLRLPFAKPPLVVVGQKDFGYEEALKTIRDLDIQREVRLLEDVRNEELPRIYRNAKVFIYPSLAEGFGMPVLEAMASGVPVITSNNTALFEAAGDAAVLVEATNVESIASGLEQLLKDPDACATLVKRGHHHIRKFTWDKTAEVLRDSYIQLLQ